MNYIVTVETANEVFNFGYADEETARAKAEEIAITLTLHGIEYNDVDFTSFKEFCKKYERIETTKEI